jgi:alkanesulfonate monooxygenase SsuD/methylene tetrahydromethanopterin reductase-like flavin-dependent oxidoreductase (luciferase family)
LRERALACERAGMDIFWIPEHHFSIWGRELLGNPLLMAADLAARTKKIRIGLGAAIITFWHPLRLAEDLALLDHLTGGRLEVGVGRGNYGLEAATLNPLADPNKPAMNLKVFLETLGVLRAALTEDRFSYKGDIYTFPAPGFRADKAHTVNDPRYVDPATGELTRLTTYPRPRQKPMPMWQMVSEAHDAIRGAAALDMGVVMWRPSLASSSTGCASTRSRTTRRSAATSRSAPRPPWCATPSLPTARRRRGASPRRPVSARSTSRTGAGRASISIRARRCHPRRMPR